jgi:hypothetical protein
MKTEVTSDRRYRTGKMDVAAYFLASDAARWVGTEQRRPGIIEFSFDVSREHGDAIEAAFYNRATIEAVTLFVSWKALKQAVRQQLAVNKQHPGGSNVTAAIAVSSSTPTAAVSLTANEPDGNR